MAVKWQHGFHQAMIATTSRFTRGAKREAAQWHLDTQDWNGIVSWCREL
jgi:hypothetical protein